MTLPSDSGPLKIGSPFADKYEIKGLLGHGGQAWVYRGQHTFTGREVAIKLIHSPYGVTHEMLERAKAEAQALAKLSHNNVVIMHDAGVTAEGQLYILMELLEGCPLSVVLTEYGRLGIEETLRLLIQAADAAHAAHKRRIIHRDLKPDNLFVVRNTDASQGNALKVLDFGIAKMLDEIGFTTRKDVVIGTVLYMSPEQVQGLPITAQSDIYALGLIMWEALIGKRPSVLIFERDLIMRGEPYRRPGIADIPPIQANRIPPLLTELDPDIPDYVSRLVQRAIAKVARQRFATMGDFATAMRVCLETYLADVPLHARRTGGRDLTRLRAKPLEPAPISQRSTAKRPSSMPPASALTTARIELPAGLKQTLSLNAVAREPGDADEASSSDLPIGVETRTIGTSPAVERRSGPTRNAPRTDPPPTARAINPLRSSSAPPPSAKPSTAPPRSGAQRPGTLRPVSMRPDETGSAVRHANRVRIRNAVLSAALLGIAIGAALMLFSPPKRAESLRAAATSAESVLLPASTPNAEALPVTPASVPTPVVVRAEPEPTATAPRQSPASPVPARQAPLLPAHAVAKSSPSLTPPPAQKVLARPFAVQRDLSDAPQTSPVPATGATATPPRKRAIYGD